MTARAGFQSVVRAECIPSRSGYRWDKKYKIHPNQQIKAAHNPFYNPLWELPHSCAFMNTIFTLHLLTLGEKESCKLKHVKSVHARTAHTHTHAGNHEGRVSVSCSRFSGLVLWSAPPPNCTDNKKLMRNPLTHNRIRAELRLKNTTESYWPNWVYWSSEA